MNHWQARSPCGPRCARHMLPPVSSIGRTRRLLATAHAVGGADLQQRARNVLAALDIRLDTTTHQLSVPGQLGTLIVANHISWLDVIALLAIEPTGFLAKREVAGWPGIARLAGSLGSVFVDRTSLRALPASVAELAATLRTGRSVVAFPEGTTWCMPPGGRFRRAALQAALDANAPVRPVSIDYRQADTPTPVTAFVGDDALLTSLWRVSAAREVTVRVQAHPPLPTRGDRRMLAAAAQHAVQSPALATVSGCQV